MGDEHKDSGPAFDPRYDPAFQRGYRSQPGERTPTRVRVATPAAPPEPREERPAVHVGDSVSAGSASSGPVASVAAEAPWPAAPPQQAERPAATVSGIVGQLDLSPRRNPAILALWIVAGGFVALGIVVYSIAVSLSYTGETSNSDIGVLVITQIGWMLAGPLVTVGLATMVALLFLTALAGRGRRQTAPDGQEPEETPGY